MDVEATRQALTRRAALLPILVSAAVVALAAYPEARVPLNGDAHWILTMAGRVLDGQHLYRDILEINPPLIVWLQLPVVWLARLLALPPPLVYRLGVFALALLASWAAAGFVAASKARRLAGWSLPACLAAVLLVPAGAFGQREQIITALLLPLVALAAARMDGGAPSRRGAIAAGIAAGIGIALKPFFVLLWVLLLAVRSAHARRVRVEPEDAAIIAVGAAYLATVAVAAPAFFEVIRVFGAAYAAFTPAHSVGYLLANAATVWAVAATVAWLVRREPRSGLGKALAASLAGAMLAALLQGKGWTYHYVPAVSFSVLLGFLALASRPSSLPDDPGAGLRRISRALAAFLLLLAWVPLAQRMAGRLGRAEGRPTRSVRQLASAVARERDARTILVLAADMTSALSWISDLGLTERSSFPFLWVPAVAYRTRWNGNPQVALRSRGRMGTAEGSAYDAVVSDLVRHTPDVLVVETRKKNEELTGFPGGFDHLVYYGRDARFAKCFLEFRLSAVLDDYLVFRRGGALGRKDCGDGG